MKSARLLLLFIFFCHASLLSAQVSLTATQGNTTGSFTTLKAAFDAINLGTHKGNIVIQINANVNETASAVLKQSGYNSVSNYSGITIYPTVAGLTIDAGSSAEPTIDLDGTTNVMIDGRVNATGSVTDLTILNRGTSGHNRMSAIRFINGASGNTIKYCTLKAGSIEEYTGIILFSNGTSAYGNSYNTIDHNNITALSDTYRPANAIYSSSIYAPNTGNIISNNNIYDFLRKDGNSYGIHLSSNSSQFTVTGNSFYETTSFVPSNNVTIYYSALRVNSSGSGFVISNNHIGGSAPLCGGTPWTKTNARNNSFIGINIESVGSTVVNGVQGNTIQNFNWSNSSVENWTGIYINSGAVDVGTVTGNTIGAATGNGSISITNPGTGAEVYGIRKTGGGVVNIRNNIIGSITTSNSATAGSRIYGISINTTSAAVTISDNTIGSTDAGTSNSLWASSAATASSQLVYGIYVIYGNSGAAISRNIIAGLTSASTAAGFGVGGIYGIHCSGGSGGSFAISNNTVRDLSCASASQNIDASSAAIGILYSNTNQVVNSITGNIIYNISNTNAGFTGAVMGIYYGGSTTANRMSGNFIRDLSVSGSSTAASLYGIKIA
ncbi:MAG TPA: hypothetical protein VJ552_01355, partial [Sediminibacterium sp.]|nr:hypothetical protein [Sediminibacterium sp.]